MLVDNQYTARIPVAKSTGANFNQIEEFENLAKKRDLLWTK